MKMDFKQKRYHPRKISYKKAEFRGAQPKDEWVRGPQG